MSNMHVLVYFWDYLNILSSVDKENFIYVDIGQIY